MYKLTRSGLVAAFAFLGLVACNNNASERNADDHVAASDTSMYNNNSDTAAKKSTAATAAKAPRKKARTSIAKPYANNDKMVKDKEGVYNRAQVMPEFPGGQDALASYVVNHLQYPDQAIDNNTSGTVKVSFVIDEKGKVTGVRLADGQKLGDGLDEEALKVVNEMPSWKPGKVKGKTVKTRLELPITFQLEA